MFQTILEKIAFLFYDIVWSLAIPLLRLNRRLAEGYNQRRLRHPMPAPADIWIQAASVGESFLAWELLKHLSSDRSFKILITTNTSQGMEILDKAVAEITAGDCNISAATAYFPFDKPGIMKRAVAIIQPKVMVLLESEMWPAHLGALRKAGSNILVINGRMTAGSLKGYLRWPSLWHSLRPDRILAISKDDGQRFAALFGKDRVDIMPNIKFDRLHYDTESSGPTNPLSSIFFPNAKLIVLGSVRYEEEDQIQQIIVEILRRHPMVIVGLFPRHMNRLEAWTSFLNNQKIVWCLRSKSDQSPPPGSLILWDTFGELFHAYQLSTAAFVGGTLAPLGGQNFLEPLISGVLPVIGPFWETFQWVGTEIIERGLVRVAQDWRGVVDTLSSDITRPVSRSKVLEEAAQYVNQRQGGTDMACRLILEYLSG